MKKTLKYLPLLLVAVLASVTLWSCDDKDEPISSNDLPTAAKAFITQYYPTATIVSTTKDKNEYEVILSEGTRIDFDKSGEWKDVDAAVGRTVPTGFYPAAIDTYIDSNFSGVGINEISKERHGYDVELTIGTDLRFSTDGSFLGFDN